MSTELHNSHVELLINTVMYDHETAHELHQEYQCGCIDSDELLEAMNKLHPLVHDINNIPTPQTIHEGVDSWMTYSFN